MRISTFFMLGLVVLLGGCGIWDESPGVPHQIVISSFDLSTTSDQGTDSHGIEEVWVYTPTDVLGVFPLPASIPVNYDGDEESLGLTISAGIKANGIAATRRPYNFYETMEVDIPYVPGSTDTLVYNTQYIDDAQIILAENFESANRFQANSISLAEVVRTTDPQWVFEGSASGFIELTDSLNQVFSSTQEQLYALPSNGPIYLEFNYKCTNSFSVGMEVYGNFDPVRQPIIVMNPSPDEWKKMYLDLGPFVMSYPGAFGYELTMDAILDYESDNGFIAVDNFKIVHY